MSAQWTILVFLNAKNDLESFAFPNFAQMAEVGSTADVNIVVEFGRPTRHWTDIHGAWSKTLRFLVQKDMLPTEAAAMEDLGAVNMGDAETLRNFVAWGRATFPAERTMLVIWDHGQGWRTRQATRPSVDPEQSARFVEMRRDILRAGDPSAATPTTPVERRVPGGLRYVSNDDDTGDKLYNRAIQDALRAELADQRLDVLAFDACLMSMVETAYALRDVSRVMVGSEELEPGMGWNYERWLRPLVDAGGQVDAAGLARMLVQGYQDEYGDNDQTTLSAVDLASMPALAAALSAFADTAIPLMTSASLPAFRKARNACKNYGAGYGLHSIDIAHYMAQIVGSGLDGGLRQRAAEVRGLLGDAVIANYASILRKGNFGSEGLAIYYPHRRFAYDNDGDRDGYDPANLHYPVEFVQNHRWVEFLRKYWSLVP